MPLVSAGPARQTHSNLKAIGFWMCVDGADPIQPVRVFVTYEALSQIDPSQVRDLDGALTIFDAERASIEATASSKYDIPDIEPEHYEGQPMIVLRTDDLT
jgi:hypothetical protein